MPVTKTAKRALRSSKRKSVVNVTRSQKFEIALRTARKSGSKKAIVDAVSAIDRAAKNKIINKNKASRLKSSLTRKKSK